MNQDAARLLMLTVLGSLLLGVGVLIFDDSYTIEKNVRSNRDYCPTIEPYWDASQRPAGTDRGNQGPGRNARPADRGGGAAAE